MDYQEIIAGTVGKENTFGTCVGRVKAGAMSFARFSTDDRAGTIRGYVGEGQFTDDPLETFGGAGVVEIPRTAETAALHCENGFEHHVAANFSSIAAAVHEAAVRYLGLEDVLAPELAFSYSKAAACLAICHCSFKLSWETHFSM